MHRQKSALLTFALAAAMLNPSAIVHAQQSSAPAAPSIEAITPIFSQVVTWNMPLTFHGVNEKTRGNFYIMEAVPLGEDINQWSQLITITGVADAATKPELTPELYAGNLAASYQKSCPDSFAAETLVAPGVGDYTTFAALLSCGYSKEDLHPQSETAVVLVIKGAHDYYTLQWAEHADAQSGPMNPSLTKWQNRLDQLLPIHLSERSAVQSSLGKGAPSH